MGFRDVPLNDAQLEVLRWIDDGCPEGVYRDWSHRSSARALSNRGLVTINGHGSKWRAVLTEAGTYYLAHGTYPVAGDAEPVGDRPGDPDDDPGGREDSPESSEPKPPRRIRQVKAAPRQPRQAHEAKAHKPNATEQLMLDLEHAESHEIRIPYDKTGHYKRLASFAKSSGKIPEGMRITVESSWSRRDVAVRLEPLPVWQLKTLAPVPVPAQLRNPCDVTTLFKNSDSFQVKGDPAHRALLLIEALVVEARRRDAVVEAKLGEPLFPDQYRYDGPKHDEIRFAFDRDEYRLWFEQKTLRKHHEPTRSEINWAWRGRLFPDEDEIPDPHLSLVLRGEGGKFWADRWDDTDDHHLEDDLAQILEEMRLRHDAMDEQRRNEEAERKRRQKEYEREQERLKAQAEEHERRLAAATEQAKREHHDRFIVEAMYRQSQQWRDSSLLRRYAKAVESAAESSPDAQKERMLAWAKQITSQADRDDPLPSKAMRPDVPEPSEAELKPLIDRLMDEDQ
ncbi:hypothetical protein [Bifidobacterium psychraerophilum]|uniref:hypothetical protein n=1 Tax=Bifidobacterium psychraerophilum TaxID=218140 RepID=UPI0039E8D7EC